ncbi:MAG: PrsW family intramembrane metalloprotease [Oscillospiraceae bacterium]|nr:PrsW family intramembrane metalloprotease [Oscillospiraceae bacterium]
MDGLNLQLLGNCIATVIPLLFVAVVVKEANSRRILLYFCWGTFAGLAAYIINSYFGSLPGQAERVTASVAPIVEELCKTLPLLLFLRRKKHPEITVNIVYCALASGVGFSILESVFYFSESSGMVSDIINLVIRTLTTSIMHGMTAAIFGIGLLILQKQRHILLPIIFGLLVISENVHSLFNLLLPTRLSIIAILMPIGLYLAGLYVLTGINTNEEEQQ